MALVKRADSPHWWYDFTIAGRRFRKSTETPCHADAEKVEAKARHEALVGCIPVELLKAPDLPAISRRWLRAKDAAAYLTLTAKTLAKYRYSGGGPPFSKIGIIVYDINDLDAWVTQRRVTAKRG